jgi:phytoene desaturase
LKNQYDVVVIGAGVGGLCAAALLCKQGYRVLVVEKLVFVGGRCSAHTYKGYTVSTGAFWIPVGEAMERIWREVGAAYDVVAPPMTTIYRIDGEDFDLNDGRGAFRRMVKKVAGSDGETNRILSLMKSSAKEDHQTGDEYLGAWIRRITDNEKMHDLFQTIAKAFIGSNMDEILLKELMSVIMFQREAHQYGFTPRGNAELMGSIAGAIVTMGGEIRTRATVKKIVMENGMATAIELETKENGAVSRHRVQAKYVISDVGPRQTVKLAGRDNLPADYVALVDSAAKSLAQLVLIVASDRPLTDILGILVPNDMERLAFITSPTNVCPDLAPPGKHFVEVCTVPVRSVDAILTREEKRIERELAETDIKKALPGYEKHGEIINTIWFAGNWPALRRSLGGGFQIPQETPIKNLFNVGDGTSLGEHWHGLPLTLCAESARIVVGKICEFNRAR